MILRTANFRKKLTTVLVLLAGLFVDASAESPDQSDADFQKRASELREQSLLKLEPEVVIPTERSTPRYRWKTNIVTTVFWVGKSAGQKKKTRNVSSSWEPNWMNSFGGYDNPTDRLPISGGGSIPKAFVPKENPFYVALPYNDRSKSGFKPEAARVIPWYEAELRLRGNQSVCRDRWIAIRKALPGGKQRICYAQWADSGPFQTDQWSYVFGNERPKPNSSQGAGMSVSPAIRDYLGIAETDVVDWCFVEWNEVPQGPWGEFGTNNHLVFAKKRSVYRDAEQGIASAQFALGWTYETGNGVPMDKAKAAELYEKAATQGLPTAQFTLGVMYREGNGVPKNLAKTFEWFRKAAEQGEIGAQSDLGLLYSNGEGIAKDEIEGLAWFNISAASGDQTAINNRGISEARLGRAMTLAAQQRSKEILEKIDSSKRARAAASAAPPVATQPKASGTGTIVSAEGHILTAAHVVAGAGSVKVQTADGITAAKVWPMTLPF